MRSGHAQPNSLSTKTAESGRGLGDSFEAQGPRFVVGASGPESAAWRVGSVPPQRVGDRLFDCASWLHERAWLRERASLTKMELKAMRGLASSMISGGAPAFLRYVSSSAGKSSALQL
jgi:hypothetical protein